MDHIEITRDGKSIFSRDVERVNIQSIREITALYKTGEDKPYTLAPSRIVQTIISYEEYIGIVVGETTMIKKDLDAFLGTKTQSKKEQLG